MKSFKQRLAEVFAPLNKLIKQKSEHKIRNNYSVEEQPKSKQKKSELSTLFKGIFFKGKKEKTKTATKTRSLSFNSEELPTASSLVLDNIEQAIRSYIPRDNWSTYWEKVKENDKNIVENMLQDAINTDGREEVAKRLEHDSLLVTNIVDFILYGSDEEQVEFQIQNLAEIVYGRALSIEESSDISEYLEQSYEV